MSEPLKFDDARGSEFEAMFVPDGRLYIAVRDGDRPDRDAYCFLNEWQVRALLELIHDQRKYLGPAPIEIPAGFRFEPLMDEQRVTEIVRQAVREAFERAKRGGTP